MVGAWQAGNDVVLMQRSSRAAESWLKRATARAFYRAIGRIGTIDIPPDVGDFRLPARSSMTATVATRRDQVELLAALELRSGSRRGRSARSRASASPRRSSRSCTAATCRRRCSGTGPRLPDVVAVVLFLGLQLMALGIIGEYPPACSSK
jgi:hypothetical protein